MKTYGRVIEGIACPASRLSATGFAYEVVGCGSTNVSGPDSEGLYDCNDCGMWFDPRRE